MYLLIIGLIITFEADNNCKSSINYTLVTLWECSFKCEIISLDFISQILTSPYSPNQIIIYIIKYTLFLFLNTSCANKFQII
jgi:hypothetical protein